MSKNSKDKDKLFQHAWQYFELHAIQRISLIKYYIGLYSLYITASGYIVFHDPIVASGDKFIVTILSIFIILITFVFYLLDQRNRDLIHLAEDSLKKYESDFGFERKHKIFNKEKDEAEEQQKFRHTHCFIMLFSLGVCSSILAIVALNYL